MTERERERERGGGERWRVVYSALRGQVPLSAAKKSEEERRERRGEESRGRRGGEGRGRDRAERNLHAAIHNDETRRRSARRAAPRRAARPGLADPHILSMTGRLMVARSVGPVPTVLVGPYPRPRVYAAVLSPSVPPRLPRPPPSDCSLGAHRARSRRCRRCRRCRRRWAHGGLLLSRLRRSIFSFARPSDHGHTAVVAAAAAATVTAVAADATQYRLAMGYRRRAEKRERAKRRWNQCV